MSVMTWFNITVVVFTVGNLMAGGLECDLKDALKWLRSPKLLVPSLFWGWVVGPALAWLIILVLDLHALSPFYNFYILDGISRILVNISHFRSA